MNDIAATIGLHQLKFVGGLLQRHRENGAYYRERLSGLKGLKLLDYRNDRESAYWLFTVRVPDREVFIEHLRQSGVTASQVHVRNDSHTAFRESRQRLPGTSEFASQQVSIPVGWWVTEAEREFIADTISSYYS
jgi:dTDP-4-amino-4,6-dideoxygalactose transaminase